MVPLVDIIHYIQIFVIIITILLALIYSISILFLHRFQNLNNIFTTNLCLAAISCNLYWLIYYLILKFNPEYLLIDNICFILIYFEMMCTIQVPLAFLVVSVNRLCSIVYSANGFFKRKQWIILCITTQWISGIIFSIPRIPFTEMECMTPLWMRIYIFIMIVIAPTIVGLILHIIIFNHVRSSSRRVNPSVCITENDIQNSQQQQQRLNRRDNHLIRRMIIMFCIFVGGWSPLYIYCIIIPDFSFTLLLTSIFTLWAKLCLLIDIINLYIYNYQLTKYLLHFILKCSQIEN